MIILTNNASLVLPPGQSLTFDTVVLHTGSAECHRNGTGAVILRMQKAIYDLNFSADVGATEAGTAQLVMEINGSPLNETIMSSSTAAAGDLNNVSKNTAVQTCCCGPETLTIVNIGETSVNISNSLLFVKRIA